MSKTVSSSPPAASSKWWTGHQVKAHFKQCDQPDAALVTLGHEVAAGKAIAQPISAFHPGAGGKPKQAPPAPITAELWWRIMDLGKSIDIWSAPELGLPGTGNEKAITLVALRYKATDVQRVAKVHGYRPAKAVNRGGVSCRAHGVVVAQLTMELLAAPRAKVLAMTGVELKTKVRELYLNQDRKGISDQNAGRIANGILQVVHEHLAS